MLLNSLRGLTSVQNYTLARDAGGTLPNIYGSGRLTVTDFPKVGIPISLLACVVYAICASTYWRWLGMF